MQNPVSHMFPLPILILSAMVLAWILPLFYARIAETLRSRSGSFSDMTNDPRKVSAVRRSFFWTLFITIAWCSLSLAAYQEHSGLERGTDILFAFVWLIATILRYRQWRVTKANVDSYERPDIISNPGK
jgi:hypothetical protein